MRFSVFCLWVLARSDVNKETAAAKQLTYCNVSIVLLGNDGVARTDRGTNDIGRINLDDIKFGFNILLQS